jgi:hypothetical protein
VGLLIAKPKGIRYFSDETVGRQLGGGGNYFRYVLCVFLRIYFRGHRFSIRGRRAINFKIMVSKNVVIHWK